MIYLIASRTSKLEDLFLAEIEDAYMWTTDLSKVKLFKDASSAAEFISTILNNKAQFDNFELADGTYYRIKKLIAVDIM